MVNRATPQEFFGLQNENHLIAIVGIVVVAIVGLVVVAIVLGRRG